MTYKHFLTPFSSGNLALDPKVLPPEFKKQRGRPKVKRIRKGNWKRKAQKCSNCSTNGHNARGCRSAPVAHGRRQRAWERELDLYASTSLDSGSISSSDSNADSTVSDISAGRQLEMEDAAELSRYDEIQSRAWEIAARYYQEQHDEGSKSDSDSELASSLFNSEDGIESGQGIRVEDIEMGPGDVEMGGIDQDGQDGHGNGGGITIQGAGISPRRTRSGKLIG